MSRSEQTQNPVSASASTGSVEDPLAPAKAALRVRMKELLAAQAPDMLASAGRRAAAAVAASAEFAQASEVVAFASLPGEIETEPLFALCRHVGKRFLLPRMHSASLEFVCIENWEALEPAGFGVREAPAAWSACEVAAGALVFVPGLAFDRRGGRLGRGAGYYDRALAHLRKCSAGSLFVGLGCDRQRVDAVPMAEHDVFMDAILTESEWSWGSRGLAPPESRGQ